jgi:hypothetical protein
MVKGFLWNPSYKNCRFISQSLAHEVGHSVGMNHDFGAAQTDLRFDSQNQLCTGAGGIMDYTKRHVGEKSQWSSCSIEDMKSLISLEPSCLRELNSTGVNFIKLSTVVSHECL